MLLACPGGGSATFFKINLHTAPAVLTFATVPLAVHAAAIAIDFANRRLQVVHIAFHLTIDRIWRSFYVRHPASTGADGQNCHAGTTCSHSMRAGAALLYAPYSRRIQGQRSFLPCQLIFAATVEVARHVSVDLHACRFGLGKTVDTVGQSPPEGPLSKRQLRERNMGHLTLRVKTSPQRSESCSWYAISQIRKVPESSAGYSATSGFAALHAAVGSPRRVPHDYGDER